MSFSWYIKTHYSEITWRRRNLKWEARCLHDFERSNSTWSEWDLTVSSSVLATMSEPLGASMRGIPRICGLSCFLNSLLVAFAKAQNCQQATHHRQEARALSRAARSLQRMSACLCLTGVNWRLMGLCKDNKHFSSVITSVNKFDKICVKRYVLRKGRETSLLQQWK